jgi:ribosomal protein L11 methylase PrmA
VIRNKLDDVIEVFNCEDPLPIGLAPIDIMTANITAELIITKAGVIKDAIKERGVLIASGMTVRNYRGVQEELSNKGFGLIETLMEGEWAAFTAARI